MAQKDEHVRVEKVVVFDLAGFCGCRRIEEISPEESDEGFDEIFAVTIRNIVRFAEKVIGRCHAGGLQGHCVIACRDL